MTTEPEPRDAALEAALARALGPDAGDTAPLSRAVLTRLASQGAAAPPALADRLAAVLADPRPAAGGMLAALLLAGALGYALLPADLEEAAVFVTLIGPEY